MLKKKRGGGMRTSSFVINTQSALDFVHVKSPVNVTRLAGKGRQTGNRLSLSTRCVRSISGDAVKSSHVSC